MQFDQLRRREFITLLGGAAAWPLAARAQQSEQVQRVGVLMGLAEDDPDAKARLAGFRQGLESLGWSEGRNIRLNTRFAPGLAQVQVLAKRSEERRVGKEWRSGSSGDQCKKRTEE